MTKPDILGKRTVLARIRRKEPCFIPQHHCRELKSLFSMKKLPAMFHAWFKRYRYKKRCRHNYKLYRKLFWLYAEKTNSALNAVAEAQNAMAWLRNLEKEYENLI